MQEIIKAMEMTITESGLKKKEVAKKMMIKEKKLSDILHGRKKIDVNVIRAFCNALGVTPNELFMYKKQ